MVDADDLTDEEPIGKKRGKKNRGHGKEDSQEEDHDDDDDDERHAANPSCNIDIRWAFFAVSIAVNFVCTSFPFSAVAPHFSTLAPLWKVLFYY